MGFAFQVQGKQMTNMQWTVALHDMVLTYAANDLWAYTAGLAHIRTCTKLVIKSESTEHEFHLVCRCMCMSSVSGSGGNWRIGQVYDTLVRKHWQESASRGDADFCVNTASTSLDLEQQFQAEFECSQGQHKGAQKGAIPNHGMFFI